MTRLSKVGGWTLGSLLGRGGNADVFEGRRGGETAAIKILRARDVGEQYRRFRQEVDANRLLADIPGILPVLDSDVPDPPTSTRPAWLAMPIATSLEAGLGESATVRQVVLALAEVAEALGAAAVRGVHHRDIKPANLYLHNGKAHVGDFGLAVVPNRNALTSAGRKLGPMHYLAPEMLLDAANADPGAADVYSLGKTLWVLASGQRYPFPGEWNRYYSLSGYVAEAPELLDYVVRTCSHTSPSSRPTISEVGAELRGFLAALDEPRRESAPDRALAARFASVRQDLENDRDRRAELDRLIGDITNRLDAEGRALVQRAIEQTGLECTFSSDNHIGTLLSAPSLIGTHRSTHNAIIAIKTPRHLGRPELLFFGGFCLWTTHGADVGLDAAFGVRGPETVFVSDRATAQLGSPTLLAQTTRLVAWAHSQLPSALSRYADLVEASGRG